MSTRTHAGDFVSAGGGSGSGGGDVTRWRYEQLRLRGFDAGLATRLAADGRFDLHALIELVEQGCRPELAAKILAPLDEGAGQW